MTNNQRPAVAKIVEAFKSQLDAGVREQISSAQFASLAEMIEAAISEEIGSAVDILDEALKKLRATTRKAQLEL